MARFTTESDHLIRSIFRRPGRIDPISPAESTPSKGGAQCTLDGKLAMEDSLDMRQPFTQRLFLATKP